MGTPTDHPRFGAFGQEQAELRAAAAALDRFDLSVSDHDDSAPMHLLHAGYVDIARRVLLAAGRLSRYHVPANHDASPDLACALCTGNPSTSAAGVLGADPEDQPPLLRAVNAVQDELMRQAEASGTHPQTLLVTIICFGTNAGALNPSKMFHDVAQVLQNMGPIGGGGGEKPSG